LSERVSEGWYDTCNSKPVNAGIFVWYINGEGKIAVSQEVASR